MAESELIQPLSEPDLALSTSPVPEAVGQTWTWGISTWGINGEISRSPRSLTRSADTFDGEIRLRPSAPQGAGVQLAFDQNFISQQRGVGLGPRFHPQSLRGRLRCPDHVEESYEGV